MADKMRFEEADSEIDMIGPSRITYIKATGLEEAKRLGIVPKGIKLPKETMLYVLHAMDGSVLGFTDGWDSAYGAAVQNDMTPVSVH
ncbi:MAG TPA: DUF1150 family protein [Rhizomicrobium sp.]|nr:DUF1150 family protein [Rhizomicrobium sp.]